MSNLAPSVLALDIGATKAEGAVVTASGEILSRARVGVAEAGDNLLAEIVSMLQALRHDQNVSAIGVGCAGPMGQGGSWVSPLNIPQWRNLALRDELARATGLQVAVDGDVRALALAEGQFGAAKGLLNYASLVVSTGIGGALVLDGRLLDGTTGNSGHIGHLTVVPDGRACSCGSRGCLEAEASGWAIAQMTGQPPAEASVDVRVRVARLVGRAIGSLAAVLDFTHCFVAGSVALGFGDEFFAEATQQARSVATLDFAKDIAVVRSGLGADGPILGAALVGRHFSE
jgi:glucokinase